MSWRPFVPGAFTTINLLGGVVAICFCIDGRPFDAGLAILLGYFLGDIPDGWVARRLGVSTRFGAEYDTIADHLSHVVAPAAIVYTVYRGAGLVPEPWQELLAIGLAASIIVAASVRHAQHAVVALDGKGVWIGLPRSVLGFLAVGYCNAIVVPLAPGGLWWGVGLIPLASLAALTRWPFPSHHIRRAHFWYARFFIVAFFVVTLGLLAFEPRFLFDILFAAMMTYSAAAWTSLTPAERREFRRAMAADRGGSG
ncbi:MAG: CDP-alcohol phosphatidyltransferase family protein [Deltaproteobacteria bacterium]|nr:CDP-alcohol phosphatidyltransferase family protein [Deltaproteobacteria bacterium]